MSKPWRPLFPLALGLLLPLQGAAHPPEDPSSVPEPPTGAIVPGSLLVEGGAGALPLWIPPGEKLDFRVEVSVGPIRGANVGVVELSSGVEPYLAALPLPGQPAPKGGSAGWFRSHAEGGYLGYSVRHEYITRHLPSEWPRVVFRDTQRGSENRRREQKLGLRDGEPTNVYRGDTHCWGCDRREHMVQGAFPWQGERHCTGCRRAEHRIWRDPESRVVPAGSVDMLTAVYLARSLLLEGHENMIIPLVDKTTLWDVTLERGELARIETRAGTFDAFRVVLSTQVPEGEEGRNGTFEGLFGIRGNIDIWVHAVTGVPVSIGGIVPVGPLRLDVTVTLMSFEGTPPAFTPVRP